MLWALLLLTLILSSTLCGILFWVFRKHSEESKNSSDQLTGFLNFHTMTVEKLLDQQKDLLNRLQSHNWTEYSQLAASVVQPTIFQGPPERVNPDDLYAMEAEDHWGEFEPPEKFEDAMTAVKGLFGDVST